MNLPSSPRPCTGRTSIAATRGKLLLQLLLELDLQRLRGRLAAGRGEGDRDLELRLAGRAQLLPLLPLRPDHELRLARGDRLAGYGSGGGGLDTVSGGNQVAGIGDVDRDRRGALLLVPPHPVDGEGVADDGVIEHSVPVILSACRIAALVGLTAEIPSNVGDRPGAERGREYPGSLGTGVDRGSGRSAQGLRCARVGQG